MKSKVLIKLSAVIDKLNIKDQLKNINKDTDEEVGKELIMLFISKLYLAENEVYELISVYKNIPIEDAKDSDIIEIIKELMSLEGIKGFLASA